jgi:hypothetical protein
MAAYRDRAIELAARLDELDGVRVFPNPPQTNGFRIYVEVPEAAAVEAGLQVMEQEHVAGTGWWMSADVPGWSMTEIATGEATAAWDVDEQVAVVADLVARGRAIADETSTPSGAETAETED